MDLDDFILVERDYTLDGYYCPFCGGKLIPSTLDNFSEDEIYMCCNCGALWRM